MAFVAQGFLWWGVTARRDGWILRNPPFEEFRWWGITAHRDGWMELTPLRVEQDRVDFEG
jgi:hypothetical protein